MTLNVGVIGTGNIGSYHIGKLAGRVAGARVSAVFDVDTARATAVAQSVGAKAHGSALDVIAAADTDAVLIASPGPLHADQVLACLAAGRPVLCEKPLATSVEDCVAVLDAEVAGGRRLVQVGFMRRFDAAYRELKAALEAGLVGEPLLVHAVHRNPAVPASFARDMAITDSVVHEFDAFRWLLGQEIVGVTVLAGKPTPHAAPGLADPQLVLLEMADATLVEVESFVGARYGYDVRAEVVCSDGTLTLQNPARALVTTAGAGAVRVPASWQERFDAAYHDELQGWVDGVVAGAAAGASSWDGYAATAVGAAALESLATGGRVAVELLPRPDLYR